jgi:hypothetical protein
VISWSRLYSAMPYSSTSRMTLCPLIRGGFRWTASSSTESTTPSQRIFTRWSGNTVAQRATSGSLLRTSFSVTVSTVLFTLMLPFVLLFKVTSRSMSTAASSRPWPTVWLTSAHPLTTGSSSSTSFGGYTSASSTWAPSFGATHHFRTSSKLG